MADLILVVMTLSSTYWPVASCVREDAQPTVASRIVVATSAVKVLIFFMDDSGDDSREPGKGRRTIRTRRKCSSGGASQWGECARPRRIRRCGSELMTGYRRLQCAARYYSALR